MPYVLDSQPLRARKGCIYRVRFGFKQHVSPSIKIVNVINMGVPGVISSSPSLWNILRSLIGPQHR